MASRGWTCRRVRCGHLNPPAKRKCENCQAPKPKKRVPAHRRALRDYSYEDYISKNEEIHNVGEECAVCGRLRYGRRLDRDHDHTTGFPHSGMPRGLVCVSCNILMPPKMTPRKARWIAEYLTRVETFYWLEAGEPE